MKKLFVSLFCLSSFQVCFSQEDYDADSARYTQIKKEIQNKPKKDEAVASSNKTVEYFFNVQFGSLVGCNDCGKGKDFTFSMATQHGVLIGRKLRTSLGLGFDSYVNWQMLPLFGAVSWDLIGNRNTNALFVQLAYGWSHPWFVRNGQYSYYTSDPFTSVEGGRMINPQIGYRVKNNNLNVALSLGYKYQQIQYKGFGYNNCPTCDFPQSFDVTQDMNRFQLSMMVGWK